MTPNITSYNPKYNQIIFFGRAAMFLQFGRKRRRTQSKNFQIATPASKRWWKYTTFVPRLPPLSVPNKWLTECPVPFTFSYLVHGSQIKKSNFKFFFNSCRVHWFVENWNWKLKSFPFQILEIIYVRFRFNEICSQFNKRKAFYKERDIISFGSQIKNCRHQCKDFKFTGPGQVVKLSTSGRLAALLRAAGHRGWCVFRSEC